MAKLLNLFIAATFLYSLATRTDAAEEGAKAYLDAKKAGVDFQLQGEYVGKMRAEQGGDKIGMQIVALGDGKFRSVAYVNGLPGDAWVRGDQKYLGEGELIDGKVELKSIDPDSSGETSATLHDGKITIYHQRQPIVELKKVSRKSPTLNAPAPKGAIVLFDGSDASAWESGKIVGEKYLAATNASTRRKFGDHRLHIEFRTPFMPTARGQGRGNSGVYIQSRYECQVLDSFGLEGEDNECGGIYSISKPTVNMCFPPLAWQTYDIDFTAARYNDKGEKTKNARVTIKHNGVVIHKNRELPHGTPGRHEEGPDDDSLFLQEHGNPVVYRNIWIVEK